MNRKQVPKVVMRSVDVSGDDGGEVAAVLLIVALVHHIDHALSVGIPSVTGVRGTIVYHSLINWIGSLVREYAGRKARY